MPFFSLVLYARSALHPSKTTERVSATSANIFPKAIYYNQMNEYHLSRWFMSLMCTFADETRKKAAEQNKHFILSNLMIPQYGVQVIDMPSVSIQPRQKQL